MNKTKHKYTKQTKKHYVSIFVCTGTMTAFTESAWSPSRGLNNGKDMQWGGGSLFAFEAEKKDVETGTYPISFDLGMY